MTIAISKEMANAIVNPRTYAEGTPLDDLFRTLRASNPLATAQPDDFDPFWVVTRHADIMEVERQHEIFHNGDRTTVVSNQGAIALSKQLTGGDPNLIRSLVVLDGKVHKDLRGIIFPHVTPRSIKPLEDTIRQIAREFVDEMLTKGEECDFAMDVAFLYPLRVIMQVLGVPKEDEPFMLRLTQELFSNADPELNRSGKEVTATEAMEGVVGVMNELEGYFGEVTKRYRANPTEHLNSLIANAKIDGEYLDHRSLMGYYIIAATAGHDTTSNTAAGAMWALAERPELLSQMHADPALINAFVDESVRWVVPVKHFMRTAIQDVEVGGQKIAKGDWLMLCYQSANRDEAVFDAPFEFRLDRNPNRQIAFGYGVHVCLGQHLARMEMRILWEELLPRIKSVELTGTPLRTISNFVCGPKYVPIRFSVN